MPKHESHRTALKRTNSRKFRRVLALKNIKDRKNIKQFPGHDNQEQKYLQLNIHLMKV